MASDEARALATLRQKLSKTANESPWLSSVTRICDDAIADPKHRNFSPQWVSGQPSTRAEAALLDGIELALLTGNDTVQLASLHLVELDTTLGRLHKAFAWYGLFGELPGDVESVTIVDLSHNSLSSTKVGSVCFTLS